MYHHIKQRIKLFIIIVTIELLSLFLLLLFKYNRLHDWASLNGENINATRTVQQIKANLQEIEKVRHQVLEEDLNAFDNKINDMREKAIESVLEFTTIGAAEGSCK